MALGGGGARGLAHLGAMQAISESGLKVDHVAGISIGAIAGALCAIDPDIESVQRKVLDFLHSPAFHRRQKQMFGTASAKGNGNPTSWLRRFKRIISVHQNMKRAIRGVAVLPESTLKQAIDSLLPEVNIEDLPVAFSVVAVDMLSGQRVVLKEGPLREAVRASASIPGVFPPVRWQEMLLCDIGVYESIPTLTAKQHAADLTIAIDVANPELQIDGCQNILEVFNRVQELAEYQIRQHSLAHADCVVRPVVGRRGRFDFSAPEELIELGYHATVETLSKISTNAKSLQLVSS